MKFQIDEHVRLDDLMRAVPDNYKAKQEWLALAGDLAAIQASMVIIREALADCKYGKTKTRLIVAEGADDEPESSG